MAPVPATISGSLLTPTSGKLCFMWCDLSIEKSSVVYLITNHQWYISWCPHHE